MALETGSARAVGHPLCLALARNPPKGGGHRLCSVTRHDVRNHGGVRRFTHAVRDRQSCFSLSHHTREPFLQGGLH